MGKMGKRERLQECRVMSLNTVYVIRYMPVADNMVTVTGYVWFGVTTW